MLQGVYYMVAIVASAAPASRANFLCRLVHPLYQTSMSTAFLVTFVTYCVLVPGAFLVKIQPHLRGAIDILLSPQGHIMHVLCTVFILTEVWALQGAVHVEIADFRYAVGYGALYLVFEWLFHAQTGIWHYPFLDYDRPMAELSHLALFLALAAFWRAGQAATGGIDRMRATGKTY